MGSITRKSFITTLIIGGALITTLYHLQLKDMVQSQVCKKVFYVYKTVEEGPDVQLRAAPPVEKNATVGGKPKTGALSQRASAAKRPVAGMSTLTFSTSLPDVKLTLTATRSTTEDPSLCPNGPPADGEL